MEEKRQFTRIVCKMNVWVQLDDVIIVEANNLNISLKGAFFELADYCVFKKGDKWQLTFILPDSDIRLQFKTEVIHSKGKMVGVEFDRIDTVTMNHMKRLMESRTSNPEQIERELALLYRLNQNI
jgi:PilZ domain